MRPDPGDRIVVPARVLVVSAGLMVTGIVVGALCGGMALGLVVISQGDWKALFDLELWLVGGFVGAVLGAFVAPLLAWLFLRRVPLGRAILQTALGTITGGALGWVVSVPLGGLVGGVGGCTAAAIRLYAVTRSPRGRRLSSSVGES